MHAVRYTEHAPPPDLAGRVECFWTLRSPSPLPGVLLNRVLPDGCTDVIVNLGDPPFPGEASPQGERSYVVGAMRRAAPVRMTGAVELVGIRFRPGGASWFLPLALAEITDGTAALRDVWGGSADELESRLYESPAAERARVLEDVLRERRGGRPAHPAVARAAARIARSHGSVPVDALLARTGVSRRHLERLFLEQVGLTPKTASRIARFRRLHERLLSGPETGWSRLALECGYYDQAHMIRDFQAFAGLAPEAYRRERVASVQYGGDRAA